ncbi:MAG: T9SS type A sorting domain-containing protein, partial [Cyclobacteriaceae bacterium]|nr:T9SS type A sorting domain-containing protein [Cyclobacteriaceae bacterium]
VNSTSFNDSSVVENNTYQYKITAVGTKMSAYKTVNVSTPDIITTLEDKNFGNGLKIFPNPSNGSFKMINFGDFIKIEMINLSGKKVWEEQLNRLDPNQSILLSTGLPKGIYILHVNSNNRSYCEKIIIN